MSVQYVGADTSPACGTVLSLAGGSTPDVMSQVRRLTEIGIRGAEAARAAIH